MKNLIQILVLSLCFLPLAGQNQLVLNVDLGKDKINKHIYGHFAEHLGRCIYGGFYVGEDNTKIKHTNGVRNDVVDA